MGLETKVIENEQRSKSNGHRLDRLEERVDEQEKLVTAICGLQKDMEHTKSDVSTIKTNVDKLLEILQRLASGGNTVIVIEHNLDVIKVADYIIDMGPEGGDGGGTVIAEGAPEEVAEVKESYTGQFLKKIHKNK